MAIARSAAKLLCKKRPFAVQLSTGDVVHARSVVIASGAQYRKLPLERLADFEGAGVYYAASTVEAQLCGGEEVIVVGGGNSAGQAAVFLAGTAAARAHAGALGRTGRQHVALPHPPDRGEPRITLRTRTEIEALEGEHPSRAGALAQRRPPARSRRARSATSSP